MFSSLTTSYRQANKGIMLAAYLMSIVHPSKLVFYDNLATKHNVGFTPFLFRDTKQSTFIWKIESMKWQSLWRHSGAYKQSESQVIRVATQAQRCSLKTVVWSSSINSLHFRDPA